jgi:hypothetical protein
MNCVNHDQTAAMAACAVCGRPLCAECAIHVQGRVTCKPCLEAPQQRLAPTESLRKSPGLAAILSMLPGLGQVYVGYYIAGFIHVAVVGMIITLLSRNTFHGHEPFLGLFLAFFWIFNMIDAARRANHYNRHLLGTSERKLPTDSPLVAGIVLLILGILLTLEITFDLELNFLDTTWPLGLLLAAGYMLWKYAKTRREILARRDECGTGSDSGDGNDGR